MKNSCLLNCYALKDYINNYYTEAKEISKHEYVATSLVSFYLLHVFTFLFQSFSHFVRRTDGSDKHVVQLVSDLTGGGSSEGAQNIRRYVW